LIKVNKFIIFSAMWYFLKEIGKLFSVFLSRYRSNHESLGELEKAVEKLSCSLCSHSISCSPKLSFVFLYLDRNTVYVLYFLNNRSAQSWGIFKGIYFSLLGIPER